MADEKLNFRRVNVRLTPKLYDRLVATSKRRGLSMQAMMVMAVESYLDEQDRQKHD